MPKPILPAMARIASSEISNAARVGSMPWSVACGTRLLSMDI
jgi:hypothetical protein